jgi:hypothetical protein
MEPVVDGWLTPDAGAPLTFLAVHHTKSAMTNIVLVGPRGAGQG